MLCMLRACALQVQLPLGIGTRVDCKWRDGIFHTARVVERRLPDGAAEHEYYVHYLKCAPAISFCQSHSFLQG
jgi:hypothetical protein